MNLISSVRDQAIENNDEHDKCLLELVEVPGYLGYINRP